MHLCYDNYVNELQAIHDQIDDKELRFMYTCCGFYAMKTVSLKFKFKIKIVIISETKTVTLYENRLQFHIYLFTSVTF
jgi:hypothetical protein